MTKINKIIGWIIVISIGAFSLGGIIAIIIDDPKELIGMIIGLSLCAIFILDFHLITRKPTKHE